jgi:hypothetical protein
VVVRETIVEIAMAAEGVIAKSRKGGPTMPIIVI